MTKTTFHIADITFATLLFVMFFTVGEGLYNGVVITCVGIFAYAVLKSYFNPVVFVDGRKSLVNAEILLYIFFYILFFHPYIEVAFFDLNLQYHSRFDREYTHEANRALISSALATLGFSAGATFSLKPKKSNLLVKHPASNFPLIVFTLLSLFATVFFLTGGSNWLSGGYDRRAQTTAGTLNQVYMFTNWIAALAIGTSLFSFYTRRVNFVVYMNMTAGLSWLCILLLIGNRNMMLLSLVVILAFVSLYYIRIRSIVILALFAFALMAYNAIAEVRSSPDKSMGAILAEILNPEHAKPISETNFSIQTTAVRATIHAIPETIDYFRGYFTLNAVLAILPYARSLFLWWSDVPASSSFIIRSLLGGENLGFGTGTTIISELYLDFGIFYVFFGMGLFGIGWAVIRQRAQSMPLSHDNVLIFLIAVTSLAQIGRYGIAMPIRYIGWTILLIIISRQLSRARNIARSVQKRKSLSHRSPKPPI
ncbi:MAG: hypothetical protein JJU08_08935 [Rhodobacteraceae bacterium]|nr:hypothetical protein [Paracoccaceae bacterium]